MTIVDEFRRDAGRVLDRLVDGELAPVQRRELLLALDDEPGGWRMCALAFVESQTWRLEMTRLASEPILASVHAAAPRVTLKGVAPPKRQAWGWFLASAASIAVAFALGTQFGPTQIAGDPQRTDAIAQQSTDVPEPDILAVGAEKHEAESAENAQAESSPGDPAVDQALPWQTLMLKPVDDSAAGTPIELRVVDAASDEASSWLEAQAGISNLLTQQLQRDGWEVRRTQDVVPIDLSDGRRVLVPIEQVDLHSPDVVTF
ncbi:MAG: hypothetical protein DWQ37_22260 [Planctomycetota bacterium]|nr:MAG: hypothetical protein DWQ37_22260 [Planctomycetota bacterium]